MEKRTVVEFTTNKDVMGIVHAWKLKYKFDLVKQGGNSTLFQKRREPANTIPQVFFCLEVIKMGGKTTLQAWVRASWPLGEMELGGSGVLQIIPRFEYLQIFNELLQWLDFPPIAPKVVPPGWVVSVAHSLEPRDAIPKEQVQCPNCGSFDTHAIGGIYDAFIAKFDNPKMIQKFRNGQVGAECNICKLKFDASTTVAHPIAGSVEVPGQKRPVAERLRELEDLRTAGAITEDEYRSKREGILRDL